MARFGVRVVSRPMWSPVPFGSPLHLVERRCNWVGMGLERGSDQTTQSTLWYNTTPFHGSPPVPRFPSRCGGHGTRPIATDHNQNICTPQTPDRPQRAVVLCNVKLTTGDMACTSVNHNYCLNKGRINSPSLLFKCLYNFWALYSL